MGTNNLLFIKVKPVESQPKEEEFKKCITCGVTFLDSSLQKTHFKSEWHLYNVKRKNSQLNGISQEEYLSIKNQIQEMINSKDLKRNGKDSGNKTKKSDLKPKEKNPEVKSEDSAPKPRNFNPKRCLFNDVESNSIENNVKYMEVNYTFFLPEKEYIADLEGLLRYLHNKIYEENTCIYCDRLFSDHYATLHHMAAKQHHKINDDHFDKISQFYDFVDSYVNLIVEKRSSSSTGFDLTPSSGTRQQDDEEWEDLFSTTSSPSKVQQLLSQYGIRKTCILENGNLSLPNGKEAVHRELSYIYKQNLVAQNPFSLKNKKNHFKFKKKSEKRQIILTQKREQYRTGKRDLNVALKSYKMFIPVSQNICFK